METTPLIDLGAHFLEMREEGGIALLEKTSGNEQVSLDLENAYRLLLVLTDLFRQSPLIAG